MKYIQADGTYVNSAITKELPVGATLLSDEQWNNRRNGEYTPTLEELKEKKIKEIEDKYLELKHADILFTANGSEKLYQATPKSIEAIKDVLDGIPLGSETPQGFYWRLKDNSHETPFLRSDVQGLATAILNRGIPLFAIRNAKKDAIKEAKDLNELNDVTW